MDVVTSQELIKWGGRTALAVQQPDGSFPQTRRGVDGERRTQVGATSSWLLTLVAAFELTEKPEFEDAALEAASYLTSAKVRPEGYTFDVRDCAGKDRCDGLVGQSSPIRALSRAGRVFERPSLREAAREVFKLLPFDEKLALWERREIDGTLLSYDRTLNHQLKFAAAATSLTDYVSIHQALETLLNRLQHLIQTRSDGVIIHYVNLNFRHSIRRVVESSRHSPLLVHHLVYLPYKYSRDRRIKEVGYHPVNMHHLARLYRNYPEHEFWDTPTFQACKQFMIEDLRKGRSRESPHGSSFPGLHYALAVDSFASDSRDELAEMIRDDCHGVQEHARGQDLDGLPHHLHSFARNTYRLVSINELSIPDCTITEVW